LTLPKVAFYGLSALLNVLADFMARLRHPYLKIRHENPRGLLVSIGESSPRPHLVFSSDQLNSLFMNLYRLPNLSHTKKKFGLHLKIIFVKIASMAFEIQRQEERET
jgi:hypothetical protein